MPTAAFLAIVSSERTTAGCSAAAMVIQCSAEAPCASEVSDGNWIVCAFCSAFTFSWGEARVTARSLLTSNRDVCATEYSML